MFNTPYLPPLLLKNGLLMTVFIALWMNEYWQKYIDLPEPDYQEHIFTGANHVPIFGLFAIPPEAKGTIIATYGITGNLDNQWFLRIFGRKAFAQGYAVVLFDWRAHGKTALLSSTLTSDGLYEGEDFIRIAAEAKNLGCPSKFWFSGYSLGGQLALWAAKYANPLSDELLSLGLIQEDIGGVAVISPNLDANRSLTFLESHPWGKYLEKAIAQNLKKLAQEIYDTHPDDIDPEAIARANSIWAFDHELVIKPLGFPNVEAYYQASSPLPFIPHLTTPTLIIYAANDPMFTPVLVPELRSLCSDNPHVDLLLTEYGGHVAHVSSTKGQQSANDPDIWWAWNRVLEWIEGQ
jgi:predicted alpha/beta-fold hydrolase